MRCNINYIFFDIIENNIKEIVSTFNYDIKMSDIVINLFNYMVKKPLPGGCHALSSVLYVALSEAKYSPKLCIGMCKEIGNNPFDHSWITVDGKIIDLAIYMPLSQNVSSNLGPIILNIDAINKKEVSALYGINSELALDDATIKVLNTPFSKYMFEYPLETNGLWTVVKKIDPTISANITELAEKYKNTQRIYVR